MLTDASNEKRHGINCHTVLYHVHPYTHMPVLLSRAYTAARDGPSCLIVAARYVCLSLTIPWSEFLRGTDLKHINLKAV